MTAPGTRLYYDAAGRLDQDDGADTRFDYVGNRLVERATSSGATLRRYVYGADEAPVVWYEGQARRWLHTDERGSVVAISGQDGQPMAYNAYDEHGIPQSGNLGRFQYTGQMWLPTLGLYSYKARFYSPTLGRFLQTDPIGYGDGLNWYDYVGGDPVNGVDPSGTAVDCVSGTRGDGCEIVVNGIRLPPFSINIPNVSYGDISGTNSFSGSNFSNIFTFHNKKANQKKPQKPSPPDPCSSQTYKWGKAIEDIGGVIDTASDIGLAGAILSGGTGAVPAAGGKLLAGTLSVAGALLEYRAGDNSALGRAAISAINTFAPEFIIPKTLKNDIADVVMDKVVGAATDPAKGARACH